MAFVPQSCVGCWIHFHDMELEYRRDPRYQRVILSLANIYIHIFIGMVALWCGDPDIYLTLPPNEMKTAQLELPDAGR